ncbi:glycosyltransferase family 22 protein [Heliocybe sulcata]|uniref:Mannosyltransferase n=1 Tax=Heliocybe sulcata TaxID=5364 RepID=A0A5C3NIG6_9AGAM|nr:glycosyltransferase family 22 protein [Heliocybe sulcata]
MSSNMQEIRFRRPTQASPKPQNGTPPKMDLNKGMLQDQVRKTFAKSAWSPDFSNAIRLLLLVRVSAAMYANIQDCDEVYNFWEPLHYLDQGYGFQTWETSPVYAIRSWAYVLLHLLPARVGALMTGEKRAGYFAVRLFLAVVSSLCETKFYRTVVEKVNRKVGRYLFFMLLFSTGMWNASIAFLPSSFAMYASMLAFSYAMEPASTKSSQRTLRATLCFAAGSIIGWPFALALSLPFVVEELFVFSGDRVPADMYQTWLKRRWSNFASAVAVSALLFIPVVGIDSLAYGRLTLVPWNIIRYNIFGGSGRGPELYGTEPWTFYIRNLVLNFNIIVPFAFAALPALAVTSFTDRRRLGPFTPSPEQSSPFTVLALRLAPLYVWTGILSLQAHKEERFMFPAYPLICFNAAVTLYLVRGWIEVAYIKATNSPYRASRSGIFRTFTSSVVFAAVLLSIARTVALYQYYHTPISVTYQLQGQELPRLLNVTGFLPPRPVDVKEEDLPRIDLSPIKDFNLTLCIGKEWHRFPGHYHVPDGVRVEFIKSEFDGLLPGRFPPSGRAGLWLREGTRAVPDGMNDLNKEEPSHYAELHTCDYLIDLDFPEHPVEAPHEPRYAADDLAWERVHCAPFLDARHSPVLSRVMWMPGEKWRAQNSFGDYCLLKNKYSVQRKEQEMIKIGQAGL